MSRVVLTLEQRFEGTPDGRVWTPGPFGRAFWEQYLEVFDEVIVAARVRSVTSAREGAVEATGRGISFVKLPDYHGPLQFLPRAARIRAMALAAIGDGDSVILRVPSAIGTLIAPRLVRRGIAFAIEIVGDPYDVFSPGAVRHPLRPFFRWKFARDLRNQANAAVAAAYVTRRALQRRYPCPAFETHFSDVQLPDDPRPAHRSFSRRPLRLIHIGTFDQLYKAPDVLVDAVARCVTQGVDLSLDLVGGGTYLDEIKRRVERHGIASRVRFAGYLSSRSALIARLDESDLFVLPSRQEGLPRAMIEAMSRGLPCVGSTVGGIPELLDAEDLVQPGDVDALAQKIGEIVSGAGRLQRMSMRNLERVREYSPEQLAMRRRAFYRFVLDATQKRVDAA